MDDADLGKLVRQGDSWKLTFTRRLAHSPEKVWRAVTEPEHLAAWFPQQIVGERRTGARLQFVSSMGEPFEGEMILFDPPTVMELTWGTDRVRIEVKPDGAGTVLTLIDIFGEQGKGARDAAGWHECLDRLICELDGRTSPPEQGSRWRQVHPVYVERLGPAASTIGPPAGWEEATKGRE